MSVETALPSPWRAVAVDVAVVSLPGAAAAWLLELVRPGAVSSFVSPLLLVLAALACSVTAAAAGQVAPRLARGYAVFVAALVGAILVTALDAAPSVRVLVGSVAALTITLAGRVHREIL